MDFFGIYGNPSENIAGRRGYNKVTDAAYSVHKEYGGTSDRDREPGPDFLPRDKSPGDLCAERVYRCEIDEFRRYSHSIAL